MDEMKVTLKKPILVDGEPSPTLTFKPLNYKDFKEGFDVKDNQDRLDFWIKKSAGLAKPEMDQIDAREYPKLVEAVNHFLPQFDAEKE